MFCPRCKLNNQPDAIFCIECGFQFQKNDKTRPIKNSPERILEGFIKDITKDKNPDLYLAPHFPDKVLRTVKRYFPPIPYGEKILLVVSEFVLGRKILVLTERGVYAKSSFRKPWKVLYKDIKKAKLLKEDTSIYLCINSAKIRFEQENHNFLEPLLLYIRTVSEDGSPPPLTVSKENPEFLVLKENTSGKWKVSLIFFIILVTGLIGALSFVFPDPFVSTWAILGGILAIPAAIITAIAVFIGIISRGLIWILFAIAFALIVGYLAFFVFAIVAMVILYLLVIFGGIAGLDIFDNSL